MQYRITYKNGFQDIDGDSLKSALLKFLDFHFPKSQYIYTYTECTVSDSPDLSIVAVVPNAHAFFYKISVQPIDVQQNYNNWVASIEPTQKSDVSTDFVFPVEWTCRGYVIVNARTFDEALAQTFLLNTDNLPADSKVVPNSLKLSVDNGPFSSVQGYTHLAAEKKLDLQPASLSDGKFSKKASVDYTLNFRK